MFESSLLHELIAVSAHRCPQAAALKHGDLVLDYAQLQRHVVQFASGLMAVGLQRQERVAIYLEKRTETVLASFGAPAAGGVFVPVNPLLKAEQVAFILADCDVRVLVTSPQRLGLLLPLLSHCQALRHVLLTDDGPLDGAFMDSVPPQLRHQVEQQVKVHRWAEWMQAPQAAGHRVIETDMVAILYTSGSTGKPKGVVLSHRNMVAGAKSVASYLGNHGGDRLLAALPLSFDAGFSQLTTAFHVGGCTVLLNHLLPRDVLRCLEREKITGLTAVPPLYIQLTQLDWPAAAGEHLRYFANTGGRMPRQTLDLLRQRVPKAQPFLMYGLTEAFRSTYLPPEEVDRRPDSIGKAIPNAEIMVLRPDGTPCDVDEPGELVHRGPLVGQGYWNDAEKTAERYRLLPTRPAGLQLPEYAVFSGDSVRRDAQGFLYFIGRLDEMIKSSGYRISPTEVEEILYATGLVGECAAFGVEDAALGQHILVVATPAAAHTPLDTAALLTECRKRMPAYMVPAGINAVVGPLPRNPNGKIDRKLLCTAWLAQR